MTPARVLFVTVSMDLGGTERQLLELARGLDRGRFVVRVCCLRGAGALAGRLEEGGIPVTVSRHAAAGPPRMGPALLLAAQARECAAVMRREATAIVHGMLPMACVTAGFAARCAGVPVLVTGRRSLGHYKRGRFLLRAAENLVNRWTDAVVPNSEAVRADTLAWERLDPAVVRVIHNGVRIPDGPPAAGWREVAGTDPGGPVVCLVANFFPYKGHLEFLEAAAEVSRRIPAARFVLVGDGQMRPEIERRAGRADLAGRVVLLGARADGADVMALSDVVALASHQEGFPNAVLEAMARAKPVVATRVGGVPEAVEDGRTGLLVPPRDPRAMASAIARLLEEPASAAEMGRRGLARVRERFGMERMVREHEELYAELLARKAPRGVP